jgi:hypothetical protein
VRYQKEAGPAGTVTSRTAELSAAADGTRRFAHEVRLDGSGDSIAIMESIWDSSDY